MPKAKDEYNISSDLGTVWSKAYALAFFKLLPSCFLGFKGDDVQSGEGHQ